MSRIPGISKTHDDRDLTLSDESRARHNLAAVSHSRGRIHDGEALRVALFPTFFADLAVQRGLATKHVVVMLGKPMCFVADVLEKSQSERMPTDLDRIGLAGHEDLFLTLCERNRRRRSDAEHRKRFHHGIQLPLPAVDQQQIREGFAFLHKSAKSTSHDFSHRRKVVDTFDRFDLESLVSRLKRQTVDELDETSHRLVALEMRNIDAFNAPRQFGQFQNLLQPGKTF